jgi:hypothetical protein
MDTALLVVTALSLAAAFVSLMAVRKMKQAEQLRSEARVATLMTAVADESPVSAGSARELFGARSSGIGINVARETEPILNPRSPIPAPNPALEPSISASELFGTVRRDPPPSRRFAFAAVMALVVAFVGAVVVFSTSSREKAAPVQAARTSPLELVSLGHSRDANALTINGVVRNPASGPKLDGLTAVVSLIDAHGGLISTKDVPLDYRALGPGEEAPFKITVPDPGAVSKYRVSFRAGADIVPHIDRRTDTKLASTL